MRRSIILLPLLGLLAANSSPASARPLLSSADAASFQRLEQSMGGTSGMTISGVGRGQLQQGLGTLSTGVAWSSIKVPIVMAVLARDDGHPSSSTKSLMRRAITASDNNAALSLWSSLGSGSTAGRKVQLMLAAAGDTSTVVQTRQVRPPYTPFGQTEWPLAAQQRFIAGLSCLPYASQVLSLMGQVVSGQRWGLGTIARARFKGGWGPDTSGRYLVRQMGLLRLANHRGIAVTVATISSNGSLGGGSSNLGRIAQWLYTHVDARAVPAKHC